MHEIIQPDGWARARGYANGVLAEGNRLYIGGQIGWNAEQQFETDDFVEQVAQTLANIAAVLDAAGGEVTDIVRLNWFIKDKGEYLARQQDIGAAYRRVMGRHFPAMTMVVVRDLIEDRAQVEIEATAVLANQSGD